MQISKILLTTKASYISYVLYRIVNNNIQTFHSVATHPVVKLTGF